MRQLHHELSFRSIRQRRRHPGLLTGAALVLAAAAAPAAEPDPLFEVAPYVDGLTEPTALEAAPDGRLFIAGKNGVIRVFEPVESRLTQWAQLEVFTDGECGLIGLALHPDFPTEPYVYVFATTSPAEQQIIRFRDQAGTGVEPLVIYDHIPTEGFIHNGGCLRFGPDGKLYFSVGDNGVSLNSQLLGTLAGKICRINSDGTIPDDNPFVTPTGSPRAVFALGFRNPFRFCFAPDGRLFVMDVGSNDEARREEINLVSAGGNYGWPFLEGIQSAASLAGFINPIYDYHDEGSSIAGCVFYSGTQFPSSYRHLYHLDFTSQGLFRTQLDGDRVVEHSLLVQGDGGLVDLTTLPDGSLAWCELLTGSVKRIRYVGPPEEQVAGAEPEGEEFADDAEPPPAPVSTPSCGPGAAIVLLAAAVLLGGRQSLPVQRCKPSHADRAG